MFKLQTCMRCMLVAIAKQRVSLWGTFYFGRSFGFRIHLGETDAFTLPSSMRLRPPPGIEYGPNASWLYIYTGIFMRMMPGINPDAQKARNDPGPRVQNF